jgi:hypothetical protein
VLLGKQASLKDDSNMSAAEAVFGQPLVLPGQLLADHTAAAAAAAEQGGARRSTGRRAAVRFELLCAFAP